MISMNSRLKNGKVLTLTGHPIQYLRETFMDYFAGSDYDIKKERLAGADAREP